jgi:guanylate kinase
MARGLLIILSGPSGVGKGTVRKVIMQDKSLNLVYSISMTTRQPRNREVDGEDYYFVTQEEFQRRIDANDFLEWCEFVGNRYGTPKSIIEKLRDEGKNVFLEIETNGAKQVMEKVNDNGVVSIFLVPPSLKDLEERIRKRRSETNDVILERLEKGRREIELKDNYEHVVVSDQINRAAREIVKIIKNKLKFNK